MAKRAFWKKDWFSGLIITIVFILFADSATIQGIERWAYDVGVRSTEREPAANISIIAIDDQSIANLGRWPWPREIHAQLLTELQKSGARVIAPSIIFSEPQQDTGALYLQAIQKFYRSSSLANRLVEDTLALDSHMRGLEESVAGLKKRDKLKPTYQKLSDLQTFYAESVLKSQSAKDIQELGQYLEEAGQALDQDGILADSISQAGNVVLPLLFELGPPQGKPDQPLPDFVQRNKLANITDSIGAASIGALPVPAVPTVYPLYPIAELGTQTAGIAHLNQTLDVDGGIRTEPLVIDYYGDYYPSFSMLVAARSLNLKPSDIQVLLGEGVKLGNLKISTDESLQMNTFFYQDKSDGSPAFVVDSFFDVVTGKIPLSKYKNKIVLIGATAAGISTPQKTPVDPAMQPVLTLAHSVSSILQEDFFVSPGWAGVAKLISLLFVAAYLIALLPRMGASLAAIMTTLLVITLFGSEFLFMTSQTTWVPLMTPLLLLMFGHALLTTKRFLWTERSKGLVEADSSDTNRMLGIAFQGQGQLDMAFEKFRKCAIDETVLENLYSLALDYERKRQFNKSGSVYRYIAGHDPEFKDIEERMQRAEQIENTMVIGGSSGGGTAGATVLLGEGMEKPMLGRYEVEKELGKGAMGLVYLGRDPKINRVVAIKTMALAAEFEADELDEVKARFFREAESAGRLSHPNIVTIYDAGEEFDLAYIAMELLKGDDLGPYIKRSKLLPVPEVLSIVSKTADALDYAHKKNIVHRDIKPANVMYDREDKIVKVTDFGIARITDSSKTKTGVVMGTPSYMSPEQLSGKHVDGRSDLFSLGVMLYQMLAGELPFKADSLATLMFKITNDEPTDIKLSRPDLPECLVNIVTRSLKKPVDERYQTGAEMKADIDECLVTLQGSAG